MGNITIQVKDLGASSVVSFSYDDMTKDEAIVSLSRCLHTLIGEYDDFVVVKES